MNRKYYEDMDDCDLLVFNSDLSLNYIKERMMENYYEGVTTYTHYNNQVLCTKDIVNFHSTIKKIESGMDDVEYRKFVTEKKMNNDYLVNKGFRENDSRSRELICKRFSKYINKDKLGEWNTFLLDNVSQNKEFVYFAVKNVTDIIYTMEYGNSSSDVTSLADSISDDSNSNNSRDMAVLTVEHFYRDSEIFDKVIGEEKANHNALNQRLSNELIKHAKK